MDPHTHDRPVTPPPHATLETFISTLDRSPHLTSHFLSRVDDGVLDANIKEDVLVFGERGGVGRM
ncbi:hypothetical protein HK104_010899 [Borealophlyctis nickersoniae]|nr:hypothetical protein HK104_010899 [Borealophlyctis nickersoniae]